MDVVSISLFSSFDDIPLQLSFQSRSFSDPNCGVCQKNENWKLELRTKKRKKYPAGCPGRGAVDEFRYDDG